MNKYRAWDKNQQIMRGVRGLFWTKNNLVAHCSPTGDKFDKFFTTILNDGEYHLMQSTGLFDVNGKEIFEGDVVIAWSQGVKGTFEIKRRIDGLWLLYPAWKDGQFWYLSPTEDGRETIEIIGDIYQNPELAEAER